MKSVTTAQALNAILDESDRTVLYFSAVWCQPCKRLRGEVATADEKLKNVQFVYVDVDEADPELVSAYNVSSVPTLIEFEGDSIVGNVTPGPAKRLIDQLA